MEPSKSGDGSISRRAGMGAKKKTPEGWVLKGNRKGDDGSLFGQNYIF